MGIREKKAGLILGKSPQQLEKIENGFVEVTPQLIATFCSRLGYTKTQFELLRDGKILPKKTKACSTKKPVIKNNGLRRSYKKIITKDVQVLIALRKIKGLTQDEASAICGFPRCSIGHIENGRIETTQMKIAHILKSYGFTWDQFNHHKNCDKLITELQDDCYKIIQNLDLSKLKVVFPVLETMSK